MVCEAEENNHFADKVSVRMHVVPKRMDVFQTSFICGIFKKKFFCKLKELCSKNWFVNYSEGEKQEVIIDEVINQLPQYNTIYKHTLTKIGKFS